jgi:regulatory protein
MRDERSPAAQGVLVAFPGYDASFDDECRNAMDEAGRFLARRPRSERELRQKLTGSGFDADVITRTIDRLIELQLLDDLAFAQQWIDERSGRKGLGPRALRSELIGKGIAAEVIDEALLGAPDEEAQAAELASKLYRRVASKPLAEQGGRLLKMLVAKGYSYDAAKAGVSSVLPPEGWD